MANDERRPMETNTRTEAQTNNTQNVRSHTNLFGRLEFAAHKQAVGAIDQCARIVAVGTHCEFGVLLCGFVVALCAYTDTDTHAHEVRYRNKAK